MGHTVERAPVVTTEATDAWSLFAARLAGAPISWGVCEVPGWGRELAREQVLAEMAELGLTATEVGPEGYLPDDPERLVELLRRYSMRAVGGFLPVVLHRPSELTHTLSEVESAARTLAAGGASTISTAAVVDLDWSPPGVLTDAEWDHMVSALARIDEVVARHGLVQAFHPHVGTLIEKAADIDRLAEMSDVGFCLDTGHLLIGGMDPADFARCRAERVVHVHLKDADAALAADVANRRITLLEGVRAGLFPSLGHGDVPIAATLEALAAVGYGGWFVIEQDRALDEAGESGGSGPDTEMAESLAFLRSLIEDRQICFSGFSGTEATKGEESH